MEIQTKTITGLTAEQNKLACFILDKVYNRTGDYAPTNNSLWDFKQKIDEDTELTSGDVEDIIKLLEVNDWIIPQNFTERNLQHQISDWAWAHFNAGNSFISYYEVEQEQKEEWKNSIEKDNEVKDKTLEHLNRSIFKQKHSWIFFIANIIITIGVALLTAYLVTKFGWK
ncbi:MAG: hypothetical protein COC06_12490 [Bacteroidales bacterium]|nr:MAG: hypothetical protein COC06_12490 [Bacteroidales bacterium]